jgi:hypothetical protein
MTAPQPLEQTASDLERLARATGCYCVCHSEASSRPSCVHCHPDAFPKGDNYCGMSAHAVEAVLKLLAQVRASHAAQVKDADDILEAACRAACDRCRIDGPPDDRINDSYQPSDGGPRFTHEENVECSASAIRELKGTFFRQESEQIKRARLEAR